MQSANASGGTRGGGGYGGGQQQPQFASYLQPPSAGGGADAEADLPSSLPSYMPTTTNTGAGGRPPYGFDMLGRATQPLARQEEMQHPYLAAAGSSAGDNGQPTKRQAPMGQWKTPPQFMYAPSSSASSSSSSRPSSAGAVGNQPNRDSGRSSPSSGMRSMTFQDGNAATALYAMPPGLMDEEQQQKIKRQEIGGISAAQFAASTGGLTMDATLLARVSGTDPSMMGSEEIKQIMRTPDLLSIYQKLQEEDDRRQRRLERNRASARVRREKKKGMVETYEGEVSKLENSLNLLKSHTFGSGQSSQLISALGTFDQCIYLLSPCTDIVLVDSNRIQLWGAPSPCAHVQGG